MGTNNIPILEVHNVSKQYPGVLALSNVCLNIYKGKVMALVGENGAGKSTIINIIGGIVEKTSGLVKWQGKLINFKGIKESKAAGIAIVHQELQLAENLSVSENIFMGSEIRTKIGTFNWKKMRKESQKVLYALGMNDIKPKDIVGNLSIGKRQMIEIARAVLFKSKLIIMDEPTSSLSNKEIDQLFKVIIGLKEMGHSFLYVSHRMAELPKICDNITVFRDGKFIKEFSIDKFDEAKIISAMIGRKLDDQYIRPKKRKIETILEVKNLNTNFHKNASIKINKGEVLGIFGLIGAGRSEFFKAIVGEFPKQSGEVIYKNKKVNFSSPGKAIKNGLYYMTEDRKGEGLFLSFDLQFNITISSLESMTLHNNIPLPMKSKEKKATNKYIDLMNTKTPSTRTLVKNLSGGNQQKVFIGKVLCSNPDLIILDEPTRGIDVNAKKQIYKIISDLSNKGIAVVVISSDLPEILGISNRIQLFVDGKTVEEFDPLLVKQHEIMEKIVSSKRF